MWQAIKVSRQNILIPNPRDVDGMVDALRMHRFDVLPAVNTMFNSRINHAGFFQHAHFQLRRHGRAARGRREMARDDREALAGYFGASCGISPRRKRLGIRAGRAALCMGQPTRGRSLCGSNPSPNL